MNGDVNLVVTLLLLVLTCCLLYFVLMVHDMVQRQKRLEQYLIGAARLSSVCLGGLALPPLLQQIGKWLGHLCQEDHPDYNLEWLLRQQQQQQQQRQQRRRQQQQQRPPNPADFFPSMAPHAEDGASFSHS